MNYGDLGESMVLFSDGKGKIHGKSIAIAMGFIICKWMVFLGYITRGYMADGHSVRLLYHMIYNLVV